MLPTLEQKRKMGWFPFEGKGLQQVETQDGVVVHLTEHLFECFLSFIYNYQISQGFFKRQTESIRWLLNKIVIKALPKSW